MAGRKALLENELPLVNSILPEFSARDQALMTLGFNTGFRISELLSLNIADVWDGERVRPQIKVTRAKMKGGAGVRRKGITSRTVPLNEAATQAVQRYLFAKMGQGEVKGSEPLFPSRFHGVRLTRWGANQVVHAVLARAGIDGNGDYGTHTLRKTFCRQVYKKTRHDLNLTRAVMGHSSCATTQKYLHVDETEITRAIMGLSAQAERIDAVGRESSGSRSLLPA